MKPPISYALLSEKKVLAIIKWFLWSISFLCLFFNLYVSIYKLKMVLVYFRETVVTSLSAIQDWKLYMWKYVLKLDIPASSKLLIQSGMVQPWLHTMNYLKQDDIFTKFFQYLLEIKPNSQKWGYKKVFSLWS